MCKMSENSICKKLCRNKSYYYFNYRMSQRHLFFKYSIEKGLRYASSGTISKENRQVKAGKTSYLLSGNTRF